MIVNSCYCPQFFGRVPLSFLYKNNLWARIFSFHKNYIWRRLKNESAEALWWQQQNYKEEIWAFQWLWIWKRWMYPIGRNKKQWRDMTTAHWTKGDNIRVLNKVCRLWYISQEFNLEYMVQQYFTLFGICI